MDEQTKQKLDEFFNRYKNSSAKAKTLLLSPEEEPEGVFFLTDGIVRMYSISPNGEELNINSFRTNSFFPMSWVLNDALPNHYYESVSDVSFFVAPKKDFLILLNEEPEIMFDLLKRIYRGLDGMFSRVESLMIGSAQRRLVTELMIYAKRFGRKDEKKTVLDLKLTHQDLANQTGMTRETITREMKKLEKLGVLEIIGKQILFEDLRRLEKLLLN